MLFDLLQQGCEGKEWNLVALEEAEQSSLAGELLLSHEVTLLCPITFSCDSQLYTKLNHKHIQFFKGFEVFISKGSHVT